MIPYKSKLSHITDVAERNTAFDALTSEEKRKEVAFDVLNRYSVGLLKKQESSMYWPNNIVKEFQKLQTAEELQAAVIARHTEICDVCARGAVMISRIMLGNKITPNQSFYDGDGESDGYKYEMPAPELDDDFLRVIEKNYETYGFIRYRKRTPECIAALMANIVQNGYFKWDDETDYLVLWEVEILNPKYINEAYPVS